MNYKLAIFDMDGTILDTILDLTDSINYATKCNNFPTHTVSEVRSFVGNGLGVLVEKACPSYASEEQKTKVFNDFKEYYKTHSAIHTKPYDGITELIRTLKEAGYITAVVSNKQDKAVQDLCDTYFKNLFDVSVGEITGIPRKPAPDSINKIIKDYKLDKKEVVYIGDSEVDIQTAKNASIDCITVTWGFRDEAFLIEQGATHIARTMDDVKRILI